MLAADLVADLVALQDSRWVRGPPLAPASEVERMLFGPTGYQQM